MTMGPKRAVIALTALAAIGLTGCEVDKEAQERFPRADDVTFERTFGEMTSFQLANGVTVFASVAILHWREHLVRARYVSFDKLLDSWRRVLHVAIPATASNLLSPMTIGVITSFVAVFGPAAVAQGIHPIHLGIILCLNLTMGLITPPLGGCLIVVSAISGENYWTLAIATLPFIMVEVVALLIITLVPSLSLYLPGLLGLV